MPEEPPTLDALSKVHGVSRERVRPIENIAYHKLEKTIRCMSEARDILVRFSQAATV